MTFRLADIVRLRGPLPSCTRKKRHRTHVEAMAHRAALYARFGTGPGQALERVFL